MPIPTNGGAGKAMLIGVISDTHDRLPLIERALELFRRRGVSAVIHAGDLVSPFAAKLFKPLGDRLYVIYGNNDGEKAGLKDVLPQICSGPLRVELEGRKILVHHALEWVGREDADWAQIVVTGHTHEPRCDREGGKLVVNPGECCGWVTGRCTVALLDTDGPTAESIELQP